MDITRRRGRVLESLKGCVGPGRLVFVVSGHSGAFDFFPLEVGCAVEGRKYLQGSEIEMHFQRRYGEMSIPMRTKEVRRSGTEWEIQRYGTGISDYISATSLDGGNGLTDATGRVYGQQNRIEPSMNCCFMM
jgi:hypothetical protein